MSKIGNKIKSLFIFKEPLKDNTFLLKEDPKIDAINGKEKQKEEEPKEEEPKEEEPKEEKPKEEEPKEEKPKEEKPEQNNDQTLSKNKKNKVGFANILLPNRDIKNINDAKEKSSNKKQIDNKKDEVSKDIKSNLENIKNICNIPENGDFLIREFEVTIKEKVYSSFIIFIDGLTDRKVISDNILNPLMLLSNMNIKGDINNIGEYVKNHLVPYNQLKVTKKISDVINEVNTGGCGIFVDDADIVLLVDVKGWEHRTVSRPNTELLIRGPQEGFNEILRVNTGLVRKILNDDKLIVFNMKVGKRSKTPCSVLYIKDIANESLVNEVKRRIDGIKIDHIIDSGELEQYLEDGPFLPAPQILATERPDRVAAQLADGKVAIILHGSPFALILPVTYYDLFHTQEDTYVRFIMSNFSRIIRVGAAILSLLLPGIFISITNFHQEMIPTDLLLAIEAAREKVPFPSVIEILIMELSFELIREAGIRIPSPIGSTIGIIGGLILGQAAVAANIVSPILIIVVAVTGIGSFAIPNFSLAYSIRVLRFVYIILGALAGFLGIGLGIFIQGIWLASAKSFGVPFLAPFAPWTESKYKDQIFRAPIWQQEKRPDYINPKKMDSQEDISREWDKKGELE